MAPNGQFFCTCFQCTDGGRKAPKKVSRTTAYEHRHREKRPRLDYGGRGGGSGGPADDGGQPSAEGSAAGMGASGGAGSEGGLGPCPALWRRQVPPLATDDAAPKISQSRARQAVPTNTRTNRAMSRLPNSLSTRGWNKILGRLLPLPSSQM